MVSLFWDFFSGFSIRVYVGISDDDETDAVPASRLAGQPVIVEVPAEGPHELDEAQDPGNTTSGAAPSPSPALLTETTTHSSTHDQTGRLSHRKPPSDSTGVSANLSLGH
jgi:hypothetical protein